MKKSNRIVLPKVPSPKPLEDLTPPIRTLSNFFAQNNRNFNFHTRRNSSLMEFWPLELMRSRSLFFPNNIQVEEGNCIKHNIHAKREEESRACSVMFSSIL